MADAIVQPKIPRVKRNGTRPRLPYYPRYVEDWAASPTVRRLKTFADRGVYCELLDRQWQEGSLPADPRECFEDLGVGTWKEFQRAWPKIETVFPVGEDGRRRNGRLERELESSIGFREAFVESGRAGGKASAAVRLAKYGTSQPQSGTPGGIAVEGSSKGLRRASEASSDTDTEEEKSSIPPTNSHQSSLLGEIELSIARPKGRAFDPSPIVEEQARLFYATYPKKDHPDRVPRAFKAALKKHGSAKSAESIRGFGHQVLIGLQCAMVEWAEADMLDENERPTKEKGQFIPGPAVFLNGGDWISAIERYEMREASDEAE